MWILPYRIVADHIRALVMAASDGGLPSNVGRGYVLRRILRRAVRAGRELLHLPEYFLSALVPVTVDIFAEAFPALLDEALVKDIVETIEGEERLFLKTMGKGLVMFDKECASLEPGATISGKLAFLLYERDGFPLDLLQVMASERGFSVDEEGFEVEIEAARNMSRMAAMADSGDGVPVVFDGNDTAYLEASGIDKTDDAWKYQLVKQLKTQLVEDTSVVGIFDPNCAAATAAEAPVATRFLQEWTGTDANQGKTFGLLLKETAFYAESGGQVYDTGVLHIGAQDGNDEDKVVFNVVNVQKYSGWILHTGVVTSSSSDGVTKISVGDVVELQVNDDRRKDAMKNHTATHLLNFALRKVLASDRVAQKGSFVGPERLRFDFSWKKSVKDACAGLDNEIADIIAKKMTVTSQLVPVKDALVINGLRTLEDEQYPDPVRVVSVGPVVNDLVSKPKEEQWTAVFH